MPEINNLENPPPPNQESSCTCPYFQEQIKGDLGYFKHGTDLIKIAVDLVRGIVEIEQPECDRASELRDKNRDA
ncbi:hypothetical protein [Tychonema sp. BBK16]|uniref:hypothetical protein n=1 Tax=Tychonema sp. BBK16 TaxID=2699888 RepID=UPI001F1581EF|nr:hypothetical protein [Tychonema sp. BBK16]MCF6375726.1 hypothetical protein [Tychonema sp. BBK16]